MTQHIQKLKRSIEPLRQEIIHHKVYSAIRNTEDLKVFMEHHVYAVWDFMSLLKTLQRNLTCTSVPWFPTGSAEVRYLINEIVVGEESDVDPNGIRKSHFELYLDAMEQAQANTNGMNRFIDHLKSNGDLDLAFTEANTPKAAMDFVNFTFDIIECQKPYLQAAIFTFGREDLIPGMFHTLVNDLHQNIPERISIFKYYLDRHIEIDGDHHSQLALEMTAMLCGSNEERWNEVEKVVMQSLQQRIHLWDGVYDQISHM